MANYGWLYALISLYGVASGAAATFALLRQQRLHVDRHLPFPRATEE